MAQKKPRSKTPKRTKKQATPSTNGGDGRDKAGRFTTGNPGGPGNPHVKRVAEFRSALLRAVSGDDIQQAVTKLVTMAHAGNLHAIRELLDRVLGKSNQPIEHTHNYKDMTLDEIRAAAAEDLSQNGYKVTKEGEE